MLLEYRLESVLGAGGFGMTYLGWDTHLEKHVAIKEYLPATLALRALDGSIVPVNTESEHNYKWGLGRFIQEARTLAKFSHPHIVRVNRYFEANGTGYMVMDYEAGESLHQHFRRTAVLAEEALKKILMPVIEGLQAVHQLGFLHRDIKPSNVFIRTDGSPLLLDFGSARLATAGASSGLTAIVTPGYAPLEQYTTDGRQGPWSDLYALAAVAYRAVAGENPPDVLARMKGDTVPERLAALRGRYSAPFLGAVELGMTIDDTRRPQCLNDWRDLLAARVPASAPATRRGVAAASRSSAPTVRLEPIQRGDLQRVVTPPPYRTTGTRARVRWTAAGVVVIALAGILAFVVKRPVVDTVELTAQGRGVPPQPAARDAPVAPTMPADRPVRLDPPDLQSKVRAEFQSADADRDGYLTPPEVKGRFPFIEQKFAAVDADGDGRISPAEFLDLRRTQRGMKARP